MGAFERGQVLAAPDAFPGTDDHSTTTATAWWWYYGKTAQQVGDLASQHNARLTQIRVEDPSVPTFAVTMVANAGDYSSSWWWYYGQTADQVGVLLNQHNARLISIDPYWTERWLAVRRGHGAERRRAAAGMVVVLR